MTTADPAFDLSPDDLRRAMDLLHRWTGMTFGESKRYYIERRIAARVAETGALDTRSYVTRLLTDTEERQRLINAFTVNETYFWREEHQFAALANEILPMIVAGRRPGDKVRLWSLPCSTGEEPYSIALWLLEHWPLVDAYNIEIVGSDIDTHALELAAAGRFAERSLARLPSPLIERYFEPEHYGRRRIIDDLRESVHFAPANLIDRSTLGELGRFDVILCRNLLIYFDEAARAVAANNLFESLHPGGFLLLGHSESMNRISEKFAMVRLADAIVYRRP